MAPLSSPGLHHHHNLILRSIAKRCVSKDGQQTPCSLPPFETRPPGAPQGEVVVSYMREVGQRESDAILGAMRQVALAGCRAITYADTTSVLAAARYLLRRRDLLDIG